MTSERFPLADITQHSLLTLQSPLFAQDLIIGSSLQSEPEFELSDFELSANDKPLRATCQKAKRCETSNKCIAENHIS